MEYIDEKFKEISPEKTVENIKNILKSVNIDINERWHDSGIENCHSLSLLAGNGFPKSNGKGISKEFARASAYGEFIERLQSGLFFYKYQSFECDPEVNLQCYAPDAKYFTKEEIAANETWLDYILESYEGLTKESLLKQFEMYAHTDDGRILCIPFYNIFEDKYAYLPAGFIEHMYSANGCCAGNTKEEALVHAFSEIMERKASITAITEGISFPEIPERVLQQFPKVSAILKRLRDTGELDVKIFDCSIGNGFPVICTRIINKKTHGYATNFGADPVLEIAIQRTLTEIFQSHHVDSIAPDKNRPILININEMRTPTNVLNQLESGSGYFVCDFFAEEITCDKKATNFDDNSNLSNSELLAKILSLYKIIKKPVLIRNYDFLGFPCYKVIVPGFSESRGLKLTEPIQEYAMGDAVSKIFRNPQKFDIPDFNLVFMFKKMISNSLSRQNNFARLSGIPLERSARDLLLNVTFAYCAYMIQNTKEVLNNLDLLCRKTTINLEDKCYFECVRQYLFFKYSNIEENKIFCILNKFHHKQYVDKLKDNLKNGTPFDMYLLKCDSNHCENCIYKKQCYYSDAKAIINNVGKIYSQFKDGQAPENFIKI